MMRDQSGSESLADGTELEHDQATPLIEALRRMTSGEGGAKEAFEIFLHTRVFCRAGKQPGVRAIGKPGAGAVPIFTSLDVLARYQAVRGEAENAKWFSTTGKDLIELLPKGYAVLIDPGTDHTASFGRTPKGT